jgi:hypothetical protein
MITGRSLPALSVLLLAACASVEGPERPKIAVTALTRPSDLRIGDTAQVSIEITNVTRETVRIGAGNCNNDFVLQGEDGTVYHPAETIYCLLALFPPVALAPGATFRIEAFTTGRVIPQGSQEAPTHVRPGVYAIRAAVAVMKGNENSIVVRSNPATITFRAR